MTFLLKSTKDLGLILNQYLIWNEAQYKCRILIHLAGLRPQSLGCLDYAVPAKGYWAVASDLGPGASIFGTLVLDS